MGDARSFQDRSHGLSVASWNRGEEIGTGGIEEALWPTPMAVIRHVSPPFSLEAECAGFWIREIALSTAFSTAAL
jgi:hypothetical protein